MTSAELQVESALERCKNFSHSNATVPQVAKDTGNDTDFGAVMYIIAVLTFYSLGIVVMIVKYLKTERKEMEEEMVLDSFFKGIPNKKIEHEIESVNRVAIHAFHTLTASRAMPRERSIPNSVESNYTETNSGRRDSEDLAMSRISQIYFHGEFDEDLKQTTDGYLTVDQSSFQRYGEQRRHRRISQKWADGAGVSSGKSNDVAEPSSEDVHEIDCIVGMDAENRGIESEVGLGANESNQPSIIFHDLTHAKDETLKCEQGNKNPQAPDNGKAPSKRNKTVIFSDAIKPTPHKLDAFAIDEKSGLFCPKSLNTRRYSDSMEIRTPKADLSSNSEVPPSSTHLTLTTNDCCPKPSMKGATKFPRRFQVEPLRLLDIKTNGRTADGDEGVKPARPQSIPLSCSYDAISDVHKRDKPQNNRENLQRSIPEKERSAFVDESSRLYRSNQNTHLYNATSSRHMTTRVKIMDPKREGTDSKKVLVTDL